MKKTHSQRKLRTQPRITATIYYQVAILPFWKIAEQKIRVQQIVSPWIGAE